VQKLRAKRGVQPPANKRDVPRWLAEAFPSAVKLNAKGEAELGRRCKWGGSGPEHGKLIDVVALARKVAQFRLNDGLWRAQ